MKVNILIIVKISDGINKQDMREDGSELERRFSMDFSFSSMMSSCPLAFLVFDKLSNTAQAVSAT